MLLLKSVFLSLLIFTALSAGEVDPLYASGEAIQDSSSILNVYLNEQIVKQISALPTSVQKSTCEDVSLYLMQELGSTDYFFFKTGALNTPLELWAEANKKLDRIPRFGTRPEVYAQQSIYAPELKFFELWPTTVDPTINIDGVYIGTEKLSHFLGSGYEYYKKYLQVLDKTGSKETAQFEAIRWGIELEASIIGTWAVGVFSYADLEANFQGLIFARALCSNEQIQHRSGRWQLIKPVDIRHYVNPNWDEAYNPNSYLSDRRERIQSNVNTLDICNKCDWQALQHRYRSYEDTYKAQLTQGWLDTSLSSAVLKTLQATPSSQSKLYQKSVHAYELTWSYQRFSDFFGNTLLQMKAMPLESYCPAQRTYTQKFQ